MFKILLLNAFAFLACKPVPQNHVEPLSDDLASTEAPIMKSGAENYETYLPLLLGKKVGFVVNHSSKVGEEHLLDFLAKKDVQPAKIFALEHGIRGNISDGEKIENGIDVKTGAPVVSLYGKSRKPSPADISDLDVIVFDIQDVGVRFYTYISSLQLILEAGAENGVKVLVFDRANPHANYVAGPILEDKFKSFVGAFNIPIVYGMTIGELAKMMVGEKWINKAEACDYEVIKCTGYDRDDLHELSAKPSPNLPNMRSVLLYPSICFFEGTDVSLGRGTDKQFQVLGHPKFKDLYNFSFTPMPNVGSVDPPQKGVACYGKDLSSLDVNDLYKMRKIDYSYLVEMYKATQKTGVYLVTKVSHFDRLAGTKRLSDAIISGKTATEIEALFNAELDAFKTKRAKYLLYP